MITGFCSWSYLCLNSLFLYRKETTKEKKEKKSTVSWRRDLKANIAFFFLFYKKMRERKPLFGFSLRSILGWSATEGIAVTRQFLAAIAPPGIFCKKLSRSLKNVMCKNVRLLYWQWRELAAVCQQAWWSVGLTKVKRANILSSQTTEPRDWFFLHLEPISTLQLAFLISPQSCHLKQALLSVWPFIPPVFWLISSAVSQRDALLCQSMLC